MRFSDEKQQFYTRQRYEFSPNYDENICNNKVYTPSQLGFPFCFRYDSLNKNSPFYPDVRISRLLNPMKIAFSPKIFIQTLGRLKKSTYFCTAFDKQMHPRKVG
ncbi:MAG: hypothetical protein D8H91_09985 [Alloprevotella sp.]|nr:MAG: hypothetical protein D8H91_09985 [Alloprevotella sp.]